MRRPEGLDMAERERWEGDPANYSSRVNIFIYMMYLYITVL